MLQSNQINSENIFPPVKSIPLNSQGKVRVLSFDVNFSKPTIAEEDILLVKMPKLNAKIVQIGLVSIQTTGADSKQGAFSLVNSNMVYSNVNASYTIIKDTEIKKDISFTSTGNLVLNINEVISAPKVVNSDNYIKIKANIPFTKENIINGYVLYIAD